MSNTTWLVLYEPLLEITLYSGAKFYIWKKNENKVIQAMDKKNILRLPNGVIISWSSISIVEPAREEINLVESEIQSLDEYQKERVRKIIKQRVEEWKIISEWVIKNIIQSI